MCGLVLSYLSRNFYFGKVFFFFLVVDGLRFGRVELFEVDELPWELRHSVERQEISLVL